MGQRPRYNMQRYWIYAPVPRTCLLASRTVCRIYLPAKPCLTSCLLVSRTVCTIYVPANRARRHKVERSDVDSQAQARGRRAAGGMTRVKPGPSVYLPRFSFSGCALEHVIRIGIYVPDCSNQQKLHNSLCGCDHLTYTPTIISALVIGSQWRLNCYMVLP